MKVPAPNAPDLGNRPTVLLVGRGEPMDAALRASLDRHQLAVEEVPGDVRTAVLTLAPDLVLLVGDAARDGGRKILDQLSADASVAATPVAVLGATGKLDAKVAAYRHGAVAVIPRTASADAIATRVAILVREIQERAAAPQAELGEATFDELVDMVSRELRSGILSVQSKDGEPLRVVLGAGRPVAAAVEEFVRRLRPLVARAEPLNYELHVSSGGQVGLLDAEPGPDAEPAQLEGLRVLLVDTDPARADALAQELRARKVVVSVADASGRGLERARGLDPEIVILDAAGIEGPGFEVLRAIRRDVRLRWASMLVAPWEEIWPDPESIPDVARLSERIAPLTVHDRQLRKRVLAEAAFDTRLESTGPCRLLRILTEAPHALHVTFRSRSGSIEVDLAEGLVVGAQGNTSQDPGGPVQVEGIAALASILVMGSARVHVERRDNPATANLMAPVDEALARATAEAKPLPLSQPPPAPGTGVPGAGLPGVRKRPFPAASELKSHDKAGPARGASSAFGSATTEGASVPPRAEVPASRISAAGSRAGTRGLSWTESEESARSKPAASAKAAFGALFDIDPGPASASTSANEENTAIYDSNELARLAQSQDARASQAPDAPAARPAAESEDGPTVETKATKPEPPPGRALPAIDARTTTKADVVALPEGAMRTPSAGVLAPTPAVVPRPASAWAREEPGNAIPPPAAVRPVPGRKQTLVMGPMLRAPALPNAAPNVPDPSGPRGEPQTRNKTLTMGSAPPASRDVARPEERSEPKGAALSAFGPLARPRISSSPPSEGAPAAPASDATIDEGSALDAIVSDVTSLPPETGSAPLASVSAAPPAGSSLPSLSPSLLESEEGERQDTVTSAPPFVADARREPEPPLDPMESARRAERQRVGLMATVPAGESVRPLEGALATAGAIPAPPALIGEAPTDRPPPVAPALAAPPVVATPVAAFDPAAAPPGGIALPEVSRDGTASGGGSSSWPKPPAADTVRTASVTAPPRRGPGRVVAWLLVGVGTLVLLAVGAGLLWTDVLGRPLPWTTSTGGTTPPGTTPPGTTPPGTTPPGTTPPGTTPPGTTPPGTTPPSMIDAGIAMSDDVGAPAPIDAGTTIVDAGVDAPSDTGVDAGLVPTVVIEDEGPDVSPGDDPEAAAAALVERAEGTTDPVAETLFRQALALDPRNHYAMLGIAEIMMRRGDAAGAIPLIEGAIARRRNRAAYRVLLGDARRDAGDAAGARRAWEEALEVDPENAAARRRLGM